MKEDKYSECTRFHCSSRQIYKCRIKNNEWPDVLHFAGKYPNAFLCNSAFLIRLVFI